MLGKIIIVYIIISLIVAIVDLSRLAEQERYFSEIPYGDLEFHEPKRILGMHNIVFIPSLLFIFIWIKIVKFI